MDKKASFFLNLVICISAIILVTGCASTVPKPQFTQQIAPESQIDANDEVKVRVETGKDVVMLKFQKNRIIEKILLKINERKITNNRDNPAKTYEIDLTITRYEKGNAFARAMLAGLGQIHIDGDVVVYEIPGKIQVGNFSLSKTFAWGGLYGGVTGIDEIEMTFADGVAATLTGQIEKEKPSVD